MTKIPILVTGASGKLGSTLCKFFDDKGMDYLATEHEQFDLSEPAMIRNYLNKTDVSGIIHCAAWTDVNLAEKHKEECMTVNAESTKVIAEYCRKKNIPMMLISTDYVFDGSGDEPWDVDDEVNPINVYGQSKAVAEGYVSDLEKHYIVRISWTFGSKGYDFVKWVMDKSATEKEIRVFADQWGSPTYYVDLVPLLYEIYSSGKYGTYHAHNEGFCSRASMARKILEITGSDIAVVEIETNNDASIAKRPLNSMMSTESLTRNEFELLPTWEDALRRFIKNK